MLLYNIIKQCKSLYYKHIFIFYLLESLQIVRDPMVEKELGMKPGQKLCSCYGNIYRANESILADKNEDVFHDKVYAPLSEIHCCINKSLTSIGCLPMKSHISKRDSIGYGKRKLQHFTSAASECVSKVLQVSSTSLQASCKNTDYCTQWWDHEELM